MKRLLDYDPLTGLREWHEYDETEDRTIITYEDDAQPILDRNKAAQAEGRKPLGDGVHVASIPASVQMKWLVEKGVDVLNPGHKQAVAKLLDDPEWKYLKRIPITLGRV